LPNGNGNGNQIKRQDRPPDATATLTKRMTLEWRPNARLFAITPLKKTQAKNGVPTRMQRKKPGTEQ
jgi:hypothetical protein